MGLFSSSTTFPWLALSSEDQLKDALSSNDVVFIFKHSTRCSISSMAKTRFEREWETPNFPHQLLLLDLLNFRPLSQFIAETTGVTHESPQLIVCFNGQVTYHQSHSGINAKNSILSIEK